jgi:hypothetical protein
MPRQLNACTLGQHKDPHACVHCDKCLECCKCLTVKAPERPKRHNDFDRYLDELD